MNPPGGNAPARRRPRVLYLMHVDWRWVKQRPHHLAEGLGGWADLLVLFRPARGRSRLPPNPSRLRRWPLLPVPSRSRWLGWLDAPLQRAWVALAAAWFRPDLVWVTFPTLAGYLPRRLWARGVVYDCMDLAEGFGGRPGYLARLRALEGRLVREARLVLCSSENLAAGLRARYPGARPVLVRNAVSEGLAALAARREAARPAGGAGRLAYVGTISRWMDWAALRAALAAEPGLEVHLFGPVDTDLPALERLVPRGVVPHEALPGVLRDFDGLVMPFVVTPLIEGVDPVKLYEYLAYGKPVLAVRYAELERFEPFVYLYAGAEEFARLAGLAARGALGPKADAAAVAAFLGANTWARRAEAVRALLEGDARGAG